MRAVLAALVAIVALTSGAEAHSQSPRGVTINRVTLDGARRVLSGHDTYSTIFSLSPDHTRLAFVPYVFEGFGSNKLWIAQANSSEQRELLQTRSWIWAIAWAPNSRAIALQSDGIWLINADGTGLRRGVEDGYGPVWSPNSRHVAFSPL